jgi:hypothetical protein
LARGQHEHFAGNHASARNKRTCRSWSDPLEALRQLGRRGQGIRFTIQEGKVSADL